MGCEESKILNGGDSTLSTTTTTTTIEWNPYSFLDPTITSWDDARHSPFALLILNQAIANKAHFCALWKNSRIRVCADGGANRLFDALSEKERENFLPDGIIGDLDSLRNDVSDFYQLRGVQVKKDPDQDSTDFGKCVKFIATHDAPPSYVVLRGEKPLRVEHPKMAVVALGGFGGRVDQSFHSIHALHVAQQEGRKVILVSDENITFLLERGLNVICTPRTVLGPCCGIIPVGCAATVSTQGFEWNLEKAETRFGGLVSTSNHTVSDVVNVETSEPVLFTIEFNEKR